METGISFSCVYFKPFKSCFFNPQSGWFQIQYAIVTYSNYVKKTIQQRSFSIVVLEQDHGRVQDPQAPFQRRLGRLDIAVFLLLIKTRCFFPTFRNFPINSHFNWLLKCLQIAPRHRNSCRRPGRCWRPQLTSLIGTAHFLVQLFPSFR